MKESVFKNAKKFYDGWEKIVNGFKNRILPLSIKDILKTDILNTPEQKRFNNFLSQIKEEQRNIDMSLFEEVFGMARLTKCYKLYTVQKKLIVTIKRHFRLKI